jgi:phosphoribosylanthranilate isomerase
VAQGATAVGFIFWPRSPRFVSVDRAAAIISQLPPHVMKVGVFVDEPLDAVRRAVEEAGLTTVQLHGNEPPTYAEAAGVPVLRATTVDEVERSGRVWPADTTFLLDAADPERRGGTGMTVNWVRAAAIARRRRIVLAGGLTPLNVAEAIATVRPFGVDVSSGVEERPGIKDGEKVTRFLLNARGAFAEDGRSAAER